MNCEYWRKLLDTSYRKWQIVSLHTIQLDITYWSSFIWKDLSCFIYHISSFYHSKISTISEIARLLPRTVIKEVADSRLALLTNTPLCKIFMTLNKSSIYHEHSEVCGKISLTWSDCDTNNEVSKVSCLIKSFEYARCPLKYGRR